MRNNTKELSVAIGFILVVVLASGIWLNHVGVTSAEGSFSTVVTETGKAPGSCVHVPGGNSGQYISYNIRSTNSTNQSQQINTAVFHSPQSGCNSYNGDLGNGWEVVSGQIVYAPGQVGDLSLRYDTTAYTCGRTQYDASYNVAGNIAELISYLILMALGIKIWKNGKKKKQDGDHLRHAGNNPGKRRKN